MPPRSTVCKTLAEMKAGSPVDDRFMILERRHSSKRKVTFPNFTHKYCPNCASCAALGVESYRHVLYDV